MSLIRQLLVRFLGVHPVLLQLFGGFIQAQILCYKNIHGGLICFPYLPRRQRSIILQSGSLLGQQLMQYQQQLQGQGQQRSRTPFGSASAGPPPEQPPSPAPHQQLPDSSYGMGGGGGGGGTGVSGERWMGGRGGVQQGGVDEGVSDQGAMGAGGSGWGGSNSTRALRRRGSSGSSEFYFVDTLQQQVGTPGSYTQPPTPVSRDGNPN